MIIYKDVCIGDELFSDAYKISSEDDDFLVTMKAKMTTVKGDCVSADLMGGNPSVEDGGDERVDDPSARTGLDLVLGQSLGRSIRILRQKESLTFILEVICKERSRQMDFRRGTC